MTLKEFLDDNLVVNAPDHLGAEQPKFDENYINESEFAHELRFKEVSAVWTQDDTVTIFWTTQGYSDDVISLVKEVQRWLVNATTKVEPNYATVFVALVIRTRDGDDLGTYLIEEDTYQLIDQD